MLNLQLKQNLTREIKILWKISHSAKQTQQQYIMRLHESIDTLDKIYLVIEYLEGKSLAKFLVSENLPNHKLPEDEALMVLKELMLALSLLSSE